MLAANCWFSAYMKKKSQVKPVLSHTHLTWLDLYYSVFICHHLCISQLLPADPKMGKEVGLVWKQDNGHLLLKAAVMQNLNLYKKL